MGIFHTIAHKECPFCILARNYALLRALSAGKESAIYPSLIENLNAIRLLRFGRFASPNVQLVSYFVTFKSTISRTITLAMDTP